MKITFTAPYNHTVGNKKFKLFAILPELEFVIDKQYEAYADEEGNWNDGTHEYSIGFLWLIFAFWVNIEFNVKGISSLGG